VRRGRAKKRKEKKRRRRRGRGGHGGQNLFCCCCLPSFRPTSFCFSLSLSPLSLIPSRDSPPIIQSNRFNRYEKYVNATDSGRGGPGDGGRDAFREAHSLLLGKLAALQTRCDEAAAASDRAVRAGINADIR
jgi:hypothetical protein